MKNIVLLGMLLTNNAVFARGIPSSGNDINCNLEVSILSKFVPCSYGSECQLTTTQAAVRFQSLKGSLNQRLEGSVGVKEVRGFYEANGGPVSSTTQELVKLLVNADLNLEIDYSNPHFFAILSSKNDSESFNLILEKESDMSEGKRNSGPISNRVKLRSTNKPEEGIFGELHCFPSQEQN